MGVGSWSSRERGRMTKEKRMIMSERKMKTIAGTSERQTKKCKKMKNEEEKIKKKMEGKERRR